MTLPVGGRYDLVPVAVVHPRPTPARSGPIAVPAVARLLAAGAVVALMSLFGAAAASGRPIQDPNSTTVAVDGSSTTLPGTTTPAPATTPLASTGGDAGSTEPGGRRVADENRKIWVVVAGLIIVAIALSLLTIRYWRRTRPVPPTTGLMMPTDAALAVALASTPQPSTVETPVPAAGSPAAPEPAEAEAAPTAAAAEIHDDAANDDADDTAPVPVVDAPLAESASARRAVAGADHASADEAWEPRGTAEHQRVVVAPAARPNRLSAEQRAALFAQRQPPEP